MIEIEIPGPVRGKGRPRFVRRTGRTYTPTETANYEAFVRLLARDAMQGREPIPQGVPVRCRVEVTMAVPQSWSRRKQEAAIEGARPTKKPDIDNIAKILGDSLNGIVWHDDAQIAECSISKRWGEADGVTVSVEALG